MRQLVGERETLPRRRFLLVDADDDLAPLSAGTGRRD